MTEPETGDEAARWLSYAQGDLLSAETLLARQEVPPRNACYLAQQAAEKALKAILVFLEMEVPRTHDLDSVASRIPDEWAVKQTTADLNELSEWAVTPRYPADMPEATGADALSAVTNAREVLALVARDLAERGIQA